MLVIVIDQNDNNHFHRSLLARFQRNADQHVGRLVPVVLPLVQHGQVLPDAGHLLFERNDARLDFVQRKVRHVLRHVVGQADELLADVGEELTRYDQADVLVDN